MPPDQRRRIHSSLEELDGFAELTLAQRGRVIARLPGTVLPQDRQGPAIRELPQRPDRPVLIRKMAHRWKRDRNNGK